MTRLNGYFCTSSVSKSPRLSVLHLRPDAVAVRGLLSHSKENMASSHLSEETEGSVHSRAWSGLDVCTYFF